MSLKLQVWSNSPESTKDDLRELGHKIITAHTDEQGQLITYIHATLKSKPRRGDLVLYRDSGGWDSQVHFRKAAWRTAAIMEDERGANNIKDHVTIRSTIIALYDIKKIVKKHYITQEQLNKLFR